MWKVRVFTLYPELFPGPLASGLYKKALEKKIWSLEVINIRDYASDKHKTVDDTPFGGGSGMVIRPDILANSGGIIAAYVEMTSSVSDDENATNRKKVSEAKLITEQRVEENVKTLLCIMKEVDVSPDQVGDFMAYKRLFN